MDPAVDKPNISDGQDPASAFIQSMISTLPGLGTAGTSREAQRRWYESLGEEDQMMVRDRIREEIARIRGQLGRRSGALSPHTTRLRHHG